MDVEKLVTSYWEQAVSGMDENTFNDADIWYSYVINLPEKLQITYTIGILNQQVLNGGFHQYFFNSYGQFAYLTVEHLNTIKAYRTAALLEKAISEVNSENFSINEFRHRIVNRELTNISKFDDDLGDVLSNIDKEYDAALEDMERLWGEYLEA